MERIMPVWVNQNIKGKKMKILITGGAGFIGSNLADKLMARGDDVIIIDNFNDYYNPDIKRANIANKPYKIYENDICDASALDRIFTENKIDVVVHLAARAGVRPSLENPIEYGQTNLIGTMQILEAMRRHRCNKLLFASSSSVYGNCTADKFSEDIPRTNPISPYGATKLMCEEIAWTYAYLYNMQIIGFRFFTVYGPRMRPDLAIHKFARMIINGDKITKFGNGTNVRDYTYIDDITDGIIAGLSYNKTNFEIINLGGGNPVSLNEMIATLEKTIGKSAIIQQMPMQSGDVDKTVSDCAKAKRLLGYKPKTDFEAGIHNFIQWITTKRNYHA